MKEGGPEGPSGFKKENTLKKLAKKEKMREKIQQNYSALPRPWLHHIQIV